MRSRSDTLPAGLFMVSHRNCWVFYGIPDRRIEGQDISVLIQNVSEHCAPVIQFDFNECKTSVFKYIEIQDYCKF